MNEFPTTSSGKTVHARCRRTQTPLVPTAAAPHYSWDGTRQSVMESVMEVDWPSNCGIAEDDAHTHVTMDGAKPPSASAGGGGFVRDPRRGRGQQVVLQRVRGSIVQEHRMPEEDHVNKQERIYKAAGLVRFVSPRATASAPQPCEDVSPGIQVLAKRGLNRRGHANSAPRMPGFVAKAKAGHTFCLLTARRLPANVACSRDGRPIRGRCSRDWSDSDQCRPTANGYPKQSTDADASTLRCWCM